MGSGLNSGICVSGTRWTDELWISHTPRDTFHIIKKNKEERPFDVSQDGYYYNRRTTTKEFPAIFKKQQTAVYTCPGRMKCINSDCDIFKRLQCLSYIANKPSTSKKCLQCSADLILDQCSGKRWIISSSDKDCGEIPKRQTSL